jgi:hypothetical protein
LTERGVLVKLDGIIHEFYEASIALRNTGDGEIHQEGGDVLCRSHPVTWVCTHL